MEEYELSESVCPCSPKPGKFKLHANLNFSIDVCSLKLRLYESLRLRTLELSIFVRITSGTCWLLWVCKLRCAVSPWSFHHWVCKLRWATGISLIISPLSFPLESPLLYHFLMSDYIIYSGVCGDVWTPVHRWVMDATVHMRSEDNLLDSVLLPHGCRDSTQVVRLGSKCPHPLSHLTNPPLVSYLL